MPQLAADRNLLFGILAVQMDFVRRDNLVAAMHAWVLNKGQPLGQIMEEQKLLTPERRALLEALVNEHIKQHDNDPEKSLAAVTADGTGNCLQEITDADVQACLSAAAPGDPFATRAPTLGEPGAAQRFRVLRPHARGGLGEVFVAEDVELHREVALKEIQTKFADDSASRTRFLLEAEVTGGLEHPGIVPVYGLGQYADGRPFYAMRFIKGDSLKDAIAQFYARDWQKREMGERTVAFRTLLGRFVDVCDAIAYAHSRGVLHRDLKPGNIMLGKYGETLVVDWGLAKHVDRQETIKDLDEQPLRPSSGSGTVKTIPGMAVGTPQYMSPEQAVGRFDLIGPASDVYSLGATLYCLLTGRPPFSDADTGQVLHKVRQGDFPRPRKVVRRVPRALEAICLKAMALDLQNRYRSPRALADDIEHWLADEPVSAHRESWLKRCRRWGRRHQILVTAGVVLAVAGATGGALLVRERARTVEAERQRARAQVDALLHANAESVPRALEALAPLRDDAAPILRKTREDSGLSGAICVRAALGLLPSDPGQLEFLRERMLRESDPREVLLIRDALVPYQEKITPGLWEVAEAALSDRQRCLRALVALVRYDPDSPRWAATGHKVVPAILEDNPWHLELWTNALRPVRATLIEPLVKVFRDSPDADDRTAAAQMLAKYAYDQPKLLADFLLDADPKQFLALWPEVKGRSTQFIPALEGELQPLPADVFDPASERLARRQAQAAVALLQLGRADPVWPLLRHSRDPRVRSYLIQLFQPLGTDIQVLLARWPDETDLSARRALLLALGTYDPAGLTAGPRQEFIKGLETLYRNDADSGLHSTIDWLLRFRWHRAPRVRQMVVELTGKPPGQRHWFVTGQGQTMLIVAGPVEFDMGSPGQDPNRSADEALHRVRIPRSFAIANKEVTVEHFQRFLKANRDVKHDLDTLASPELLGPIIQVSWFQAAMYCRWLSEQEGIPENQMCFPPIQQIKDGMTLPADYLRRTGYRLATEAEWEFACRAGAATSRYYGNSVDLLPQYAWFQTNTRNRTQLVGRVMPNDLGLFDVLGNAREWCMDRYADYPNDKLTEDVEGQLRVSDRENRVARGGGFSDPAFKLRCAIRTRLLPSDLQRVDGFRLVRTMPAK